MPPQVQASLQSLAKFDGEISPRPTRYHQRGVRIGRCEWSAGSGRDAVQVCGGRETAGLIAEN